MKISFKGAHYPKDVILHTVFFYVRYGVSYRDLEEILAERGVAVDHATDPEPLGCPLFATDRL
ncbi:IS6 family transposase [Methylovulum psychrotolerans]|uniref:IS6 family transposase n=1 Tax=Methylovulum psychrotolerans TaxID=1704499 RepID=A0A2S5CFX0_9GAMM|nr:IS6 family transposase [Methylovulum psychrotolerans]